MKLVQTAHGIYLILKKEVLQLVCNFPVIIGEKTTDPKFLLHAGTPKSQRHKKNRFQNLIPIHLPPPPPFPDHPCRGLEPKAHSQA
jgi:hypothetical protein